MVSKSNYSVYVAIIMIMNLVFVGLANGCYTCTNTKPIPNPSPLRAKCPRDALKFGICADVLKGTVAGAVVGTPPEAHCCSLLEGLVDLEAAVCLCTAIKANILGINLNIPISLSLLISTCDKNIPSDFQCA